MGIGVSSVLGIVVDCCVSGNTIRTEIITGFFVLGKKSCNAVPDRKNCPLELINPVMLMFQAITGINQSCNLNFSGIPEIVCRRLSPSLLSMWGDLVLVNQVKGPNQVIINQVIN